MSNEMILYRGLMALYDDVAGGFNDIHGALTVIGKHMKHQKRVNRNVAALALIGFAYAYISECRIRALESEIKELNKKED